MSQLVLTAVGGDLAETLSLNDSTDLVPGTADLLVAVEAAPVNNADMLFAAGRFAVYPQVPAAMGGEGAGRVRRVGPGADPALAGRRVLLLPTFRYGTWADQVVVPARDVIPVPDQADPLQLAMLPVNPATAYPAQRLRSPEAGRLDRAEPGQLRHRPVHHRPGQAGGP